MRFNKSDLIRKLYDDGIIISTNNLNEVINIYNFYLEILKEFYKNNNATPEFHFSNLKCLIILQQMGLLHYVDIVFVLNHIIDSFDSSFTSTDVMDFFHNYLEGLIYLKHEYDGYFAYHYFRINSITIQIVVSSLKDKIMESKYISEDYKKVINKFSQLFHIGNTTRFHIHRIENFEYIDLNQYVNYVYYYFVKNKLLINDYERVSSFLDSIINDAQSTIERVNLLGITYSSRYELLNYIDSVYKSFDSKKAIITK